MFKFICDFCGKEVLRSTRTRGKTIFCNNRCRGDYQKDSFKGENNPNFGKRWGEELRKKRSEDQKQLYIDHPERLYINGNANRGKKFSEEVRKKMSISRTGRKCKPMSEQSKKNIGAASKAKFTDEYKAKMKKIMTSRGYWISNEDKDKYSSYLFFANWVARMFDLFPDKFSDYSQIGSFHIVRDHMFSRKSGYELGVFPEILRHPENCNIITRAENTRKGISKTVPRDSISLEELFSRIETSNRFNWKEHTICLDLISKYRLGERYNREDYLNAIKAA